jgi:phosphate/phosphite/phosphonate ABC transporter binding protein
VASAGSRPLVYGLTWQKSAEPVGQRFADFTGWLSRETDLKIVPRVALSYEDLSRMLREGQVDVAWLPPIIYAQIERTKIALPLVSHQRAAQASYESVLLVRTAWKVRNLEGLRGSRAAWVDPWSASGYVLPRVKLSALGLDPRTLFAKETFTGSHDAFVRALLEDKADVGGTFARLDRSGHAVRGGWSTVPKAEGNVRVLTTFGPIPSDVTVVRSDLPEPARQALRAALVRAMRSPEVSEIVSHVFGVEEFSADGLPSYDGLRRSLDQARALGLIQ